MSRFYFHTKTHDVSIGGSERCHFKWLCTQLFDAWLGDSLHPSVLQRFRKMLRPDHYASRAVYDRDCEQRLKIALHGDDPYVLEWNGHPINLSHLRWNTALALGSNPVKLAARLHAQCEIHAWVAGSNREWLACIIEEGLHSGIFRTPLRQPPYEWIDVVTLLREDAQEAVITSSSYTAQFSSMPRTPPPLLELRPDNWSTYRIGTGITGMDLTAEDWEQRLTKHYPRQGKNTHANASRR